MDVEKDEKFIEKLLLCVENIGVYKSLLRRKDLFDAASQDARSKIVMDGLLGNIPAFKTQMNDCIKEICKLTED